MKRENAEVVQRQFAALEHGLDGATEPWHPDIEWRAVEGAADDVATSSRCER
jgi:ketosteroid isomerase-like protein